MYISRDVFVNKLVACDRGIFVFIAFSDDDQTKLLTSANKLRRFLLVHIDLLYVFFLSADKKYVVKPDFKGLIAIDDPETYVRAIYESSTSREMDISEQARADMPEKSVDINQNNAEMDGNRIYVHSGQVYIIIETMSEQIPREPEDRHMTVNKSTLEAIDAICTPLVHGEYPGSGSRTDREGNQYILKSGEVKLKGFNTGIIGKERWYRVSEEDPVRIFMMTVLGGWFGLHKLAKGNIIGFFIYLLTCGGCGVFYLLDVLSWTIGNASYEIVDYYEEDVPGRDKTKLIRVKDKVYYKRLPAGLMGIVGLLVSIVIFLLAFNLLYRNLYSAVSTGMAGIGNAITPEDARMVSEMVDNVPFLNGIGIFEANPF